MLPELKDIRGIHPGSALRYALKANDMKSVDLAKAVGEHKQTISAILNKRRRMTPALSIRLGQFLGVKEDYFMSLQASFDVQLELEKRSLKPDLSKIRSVVFWDTDLTKINWEKSKRAIIKRIYERGNEEERRLLSEFYGEDVVQRELQSLGQG